MPAPLLDLVRARVSGEFRGPKGSLGEFHGPCPVCGGTDRFHVFPDQAPRPGIGLEAGASGGFWCRSCGLAGDYVEWLRAVEGYDWKKIREFLGVGEGGGRREAGARPAKRAASAPRVGRELADLPEVGLPSAAWREHAEKFAASCAEALESAPGYARWLERRGVTMAVARAFGLGRHAGESVSHGAPCSFRSRASWGLPEKTDASGRAKPLWLPRGLVLPKRRNGELVGLRIRREKADLAGGGSKYLQVEGGGTGCFISPLDAPAYVVVEAQLCALAVLSAGVPDVGACAVESLGTYPDAEAAEALGKAVWVGLALDFEPSMPESDASAKARMNAGQRARSWWASRFPRCERLPVPVGKDVGEFVERAGLDALRVWLESILPRALRPNARAPRGRVDRALEPAAATVLEVPEPVVRLDALMRLHGVGLDNGPEAFGLAVRDLREQLPFKASGEMSDLLFGSGEVSAWLAEHHGPGRIRPGRLIPEAR